jgi:hypothetical protein
MACSHPTDHSPPLPRPTLHYARMGIYAQPGINLSASAIPHPCPAFCFGCPGSVSLSKLAHSHVLVQSTTGLRHRAASPCAVPCSGNRAMQVTMIVNHTPSAQRPARRCKVASLQGPVDVLPPAIPQGMLCTGCPANPTPPTPSPSPQRASRAPTLAPPLNIQILSSQDLVWLCVKSKAFISLIACEARRPVSNIS